MIQKIIKNSHLLLSMFLVCSFVYGQENTSWMEIIGNANDETIAQYSTERQMKFFQAFPHTSLGFQRLYFYHEQGRLPHPSLSVRQFESLTAINDSLICARLLSLGIGMQMACDGPNDLQEMIHRKMGCTTCILRDGRHTGKKKDSLSDIMFHLQTQIPRQDRFRFWTFYWSSRYFEEDGGRIDDSHQVEVKRLENHYSKQYPEVTKDMTEAYDMVYGGILWSDEEYAPGYFGIKE